MTIRDNVIGLFCAALLWGFGWWREKRHTLGVVPIIPPVYIQFTALLAMIIFSANLIALYTGVEWSSPFKR